MDAPLIKAALLAHHDMWMFVFDGSVCWLLHRSLNSSQVRKILVPPTPPSQFVGRFVKCFFIIKYCIPMSNHYMARGLGHLPKRMYLPGGPLGPLKADG